MVLIIDNYDSFTYNIYQYVGHFNPDVKVVENDKISIVESDKSHKQKPDSIHKEEIPIEMVKVKSLSTDIMETESNTSNVTYVTSHHPKYIICFAMIFGILLMYSITLTFLVFANPNGVISELYTTDNDTTSTNTI